jgi:hypothetical protein
LEAEIEGALEPVEDFGATAGLATGDKGCNFFLRGEDLLLPGILLIVAELLGELVE